MSKPKPKLVCIVYLIALVLSHGYQHIAGDQNDQLLPGMDSPSIQIPNRDSDGQVIENDLLNIVYEEWGQSFVDENTPVLLMHGAPGMGTDFARIGGLLTTNNRQVLAPDLIGFARSDMGNNISYRVQSEHMITFLDSMGIDQVHLVGWSNGGGVGIHMTHNYPERVASLTMLASVGAQETEGSGSYGFEHLKYAIGLGLVSIPDLIPHFGFLGSGDLRRGWLWSFWDSDQRKLTNIMPAIETPVMIVHGRDDFLVYDWAAEKHHQMMPTSKLVMLDASHFLPFMQPEITASYLNSFFEKHDQRGVLPDTDYINLAPIPMRTGFDGLLYDFGLFVLSMTWWAQLIACIFVVRYFKVFGFASIMILVGMMMVDFGVAILGMLIGRLWWMARGARVIDQPRSIFQWFRGVLFVLPVFVIGTLMTPWVLNLTERFGLKGFITSFVVMVVLISLVRFIFTFVGRSRLRGQWNRFSSHEYWFRGVIYLPVLWWGLKRMFKRKWLIELTVLNPGYAPDAGVMSESKMDINRKLGDTVSHTPGSGDDRQADEAVLHCVLVDSDDVDERSSEALNAVHQDRQLGGYPVFCKPDRGEQGRAVRKVKNDEQLIEYCTSTDEPFVIQRTHHGPMEVGVLWVRHVESISNPNYSGPTGRIYAITIKHFPKVTGDGTRTLARLILDHPRYRAQACMFFDRLRDQLSMVPSHGEVIALGDAGNHAQGAMFTDGAHLISNALTKRLNQIIDQFHDEQGQGFDIGRFDLRCESLEQLADGKGFGIVELNGLTSEPTNLYDPNRSIFWAWDVLLGYWKEAERIADTRIEHRKGELMHSSGWSKIRNGLIRVMLFP